MPSSTGSGRGSGGCPDPSPGAEGSEGGVLLDVGTGSKTVSDASMVPLSTPPWGWGAGRADAKRRKGANRRPETRIVRSCGQSVFRVVAPARLKSRKTACPTGISTSYRRPSAIDEAHVFCCECCTASWVTASSRSRSRSRMKMVGNGWCMGTICNCRCALAPPCLLGGHGLTPSQPLALWQEVS